MKPADSAADADHVLWARASFDSSLSARKLTLRRIDSTLHFASWHADSHADQYSASLRWIRWRTARLITSS